MSVRPALATGDLVEEPQVGEETVLDALGSERCRAIVDALRHGSLTADELAERLAIPISTVYRHVGTLAEAGLVTESIRIDPGGHNRREYTATTATITVSFDDGVTVHLLDADD
ncbi:ArsR/SmtB family transcription factor [Halobacteriales archaeon Cl-PHB]